MAYVFGNNAFALEVYDNGIFKDGRNFAKLSVGDSRKHISKIEGIDSYALRAGRTEDFKEFKSCIYLLFRAFDFHPALARYDLN